MKWSIVLRIGGMNGEQGHRWYRGILQMYSNGMIMDELMDSTQGGKGSIWTEYGPYSGTGTQKVQNGCGPTDGTIIMSVDLPYTGMTDVVMDVLPAVKECSDMLLKWYNILYPDTPVRYMDEDKQTVEVELLRTTWSQQQHISDNMCRVVDHNTSIENGIWSKIHDMEDSTSKLKRKLVCYRKHEYRLSDKIGRSGLRAAVVPHPEYATSDLYLLLSGVDRSAFVMLLNDEIWLERVPLCHHLSPWAWKVR